MSLDDDEGDRRLLDRLLHFDLERFGSVLGFTEASPDLTDADAAELLNLAERLSRRPVDAARLRCLTICGLLWEHRQEHWHGAPAFIIHLLSRLGLGPAMPMVDPQYDSRTQRLRPLGSVAMEAAVTARCLEHEVLAGGGATLLLSTFQHDVWRALDRYPRLGISAPTSAGKSHVLVYRVVDLLHRNPGIAVFVVPTLSLIQQVSSDVRKAASQLGASLEVLQTFAPGDSPRANSVVYVLTQERALSALGQSDGLSGARIVVIDEVQNIERVANEDNDRSRTLLDVIQEFEFTRRPERVVISGPRVENIGQLTRQLFGVNGESITAELPPVVNLTYCLAKQGAQVLLKQYSTVSESPRAVPIRSNSIPESIFGRREYSDGAYSLLAAISGRIAAGHGALVFAPTSSQASKTAIELAGRISLPKSEAVSSLEDYAKETVHQNYALAGCLHAGVAYHHGKMPQHLRVAVEHAFARQDVAAVVCTTTLMQGVNLPAKYLIARNPHLYTRRSADSVSLTPYEFANLRGRAGRLLKDFVGRTIVLDESEFSAEGGWFQSPGKAVAYGYEARFNEHRDEIMERLLGPDDMEVEGTAYDLIAYIRQAVFRHGTDALGRLQKVGITVSDDEFHQIANLLDVLEVPRELCNLCPQWDPIQLDALYRAQSVDAIPEVPQTPFTPDFVGRLLAVLDAVRSIVPYYYRKFIGPIPSNLLLSIGIAAQRWAAEDPLRDIIRWGRNAETLPWEEIDRRLSRITKSVMYDLPKLLRPIALIQDPQNPLIGFIEMGAFRPATRRLVELGLPRETAVRVVNEAGALTSWPHGHPDDGELIATARAVSERLNFWEQLQVRETFRTR